MAVDHHTYVIKSGERPHGAGSYGRPEDVKNMIDGTHPRKITDVAQAYDAMGNAIIDVQNALWEAAKVLADHWAGPAADTAQSALRRLYATAGELVVRSNETAKTLQWYGGSILPMYRAIQWPQKNTDSPAAAAAADQVMKNLNERIAQTWDGMPPQIEKNLPLYTDRGDRGNDGAGPVNDPGGGTGGGYTGSGGVHVPRSSGVHVPLPRDGGDSPHGSVSRAPHPGAGGADLAGGTPSTPGGLGGGPLLGNNPLPGSATGGSALVPGAPGPMGLGLGSSGGTFLPGISRAGVGRMNAPGELEPPRAAERGQAAGPSSGAGRSAENGLPLASGGGGSDEKERGRTTWLSEDRDVWTGDAGAVPGVIGDAPNLLERRQQNDDELLTVDELQELLNLVDEPAKETGEDLNQPSTFYIAHESALLEGLDSENTHVVNSAQTSFALGDENLIEFDGDFFGPDDDASGIQRA
ncbi:hypothetical protein GCM10023195_61500 [Actinoallomurus liliacearum]|uniref:PPE family domain-containing protein n=1 Tax=Actinoallomurus liliacearum TaxID=1080073 RepID=A0ABP8TU44_9ACTN